MNKLLIICGPTATGKTALGIEFAKKLEGELISADSRQVYKGMDIGTGKDLPVSSKFMVHSSQFGSGDTKLEIGCRKKDGIPIWLVDVVEPDYRFNVKEYRECAERATEDLRLRHKLPIVVGGTGLYIRSLLEPLSDMHVPPNVELRTQLQDVTLWGLQVELQNMNPVKWERMNYSDRNNPRRLIRAIEIAMWKKDNSHQPSAVSHQTTVDYLLIGLTAPYENLKKRVLQRVDERVQQGIIKEIQVLLDKGYVWDLPAMSAMGYRQWEGYFEALSVKRLAFRNEEQTKTQTIEKWGKDEYDYARQQKTWFKKMKGINWFDVTETDYKKQVFTLVDTWYNS